MTSDIVGRLRLDHLWDDLSASTSPTSTAWPKVLRPATEQAFVWERNGHWPRWQTALAGLPAVLPSTVDLSAPAITLGEADDLDPVQQGALPGQLAKFHPWRKGPWSFFGVSIDTEWRSDWKWARLARHLGQQEGARVLDIGSGNGYYSWRWRGAGARFVLGIDPFLAYTVQFAAAKTYLADEPVFQLPLRLEVLDGLAASFDVVCSLGVIYHQRDPMAHLRRLRELCRPGGCTFVESITVPGRTGEFLIPPERYARMRNVHWLPTPGTLEQALAQAGWREPQLLHEGPTTLDEQRSTTWMRFESLAECLDPNDSTRTIEGHPAPRRSLVRAFAP